MIPSILQGNGDRWMKCGSVCRKLEIVTVHGIRWNLQGGCRFGRADPKWSEYYSWCLIFGQAHGWSFSGANCQDQLFQGLCDWFALHDELWRRNRHVAHEQSLAVLSRRWLPRNAHKQQTEYQEEEHDRCDRFPTIVVSSEEQSKKYKYMKNGWNETDMRWQK